MKAYIQTKNGVPTDQDHFNAYLGFKEMGIETIFFETYEELSRSEKEDVVIGYIGTVKSRLKDFGKEIDDMDYPASLASYLGRKLWKSTVNTVNANPELWPIFIKPINNKRFKGRVVRNTADLIGCGSCYEDYPIYCSEIKEIVTEYRVFVRYGKVLDVRRYGGEWTVACSKQFVESCINDFQDAPKAYAMDIGITKDGENILRIY